MDMFKICGLGCDLYQLSVALHTATLFGKCLHLLIIYNQPAFCRFYAVIAHTHFLPAECFVNQTDRILLASRLIWRRSQLKRGLLDLFCQLM